VSTSPAAAASFPWRDVREVTAAPSPALAMGLSGLIPFAAPPIFMLNGGLFSPWLATAELAYGASILSFLGGVRWGVLVTPGGPLPPSSWLDYTLAVAPSLAAWCAILVPSTSAGSLLCAGSLAAVCYVDATRDGYPKWFKGLRLVLTSGAVVSLLLTATLAAVLPDDEKADEVSH